MTAPRRVRLSPGSGGPRRLLRSAPLSASSPAVKRPGMVTAAALVTLCVVAGLYWPSAGDGLARLLFAGLALGFIAFRAYQVIPPVRSHPDSPFDRDAPPQETTAVPLPLARIDRAVGADDRRSGTTTGRIPPGVTAALREEAARRLLDDHRLDLDDPADHPRIRALMSEQTWLLLQGPNGTGRSRRPGAAGSATGQPLLAQLDSILADLERL